MKTLIAAIVVVALSATVHVQDAPQRRVVNPPTLTAAPPTLDVAVTAFEVMAKQRTNTQTRTASQKKGLEPVTRDWEIHSAHLIAKSREIVKLKGVARERKTQEIIDHALLLIAEDSRQGNEDREQATFSTVRNVLAALAVQSSK